jgi:hypothetical protein
MNARIALALILATSMSAGIAKAQTKDEVVKATQTGGVNAQQATSIDPVHSTVKDTTPAKNAKTNPAATQKQIKPKKSKPSSDYPPTDIGLRNQ